MQLICKGQTEEIETLLSSAPSFAENPGFTDAVHYKFQMFQRNINELSEEKVCSPLAIAVNIGEPRLVDVIISGLHGVDVEFGLQITSKTPVHQKSNMYSN